MIFNRSANKVESRTRRLLSLAIKALDRVKPRVGGALFKKTSYIENKRKFLMDSKHT
jgi:hypothetical protein